MGSTTNAAESSTTGNRHLAAVPYPGRGHINPMLNLCRLIASKSPNLIITFIVTEEWLGFLTDGSEPKPPPNFSFGVIPQVVPSEVGRAADISGFVEAVYTKMEAPVERLLDRLEPPVTALVYDAFLYWAVEVANRRDIPAAGLNTASASMLCVLSHFDLFVQNGHIPLNVAERGNEVVDYIPGVPPTSIADFPNIFHNSTTKIFQKILQSIKSIQKSQFLLLASTPDLEAPAIEALTSKFSSTTTVLPIGPMIPYINLPSSSASDPQFHLQWLDNQPTKSVLYVSMGSFLSASTTQTDEIISGIVNSGVNYLFVTRGDDSRFRIGGGGEERGCLVKWCDQLRVLSHRAVGGFWTHCGWGSTSEAMFAGVPMLAFPIVWDQLLSGKMVADDWGIGRRVRRERGEGLIGREEIGEIVRDFMAGDGRREMVDRAERVSRICRSAVASGGEASRHLDAFVDEISRAF